MVLQDYKLDGQSISISKKELEQWEQHYIEIAKSKRQLALKMFYLGKAEVMHDILKTMGY